MNVQLFRKIRLSGKEGFNEENLSAQQPQAEKDPWFFGKDEYQERSQCFKAETIKGKEEIDRLDLQFLRMKRKNIDQRIEVYEDNLERILRFYKNGEDQVSSGFQKGDEDRQEAFFTEFPAFYKEK